MNKLIISLLKEYKKHVSPFLERTFGKACRFTPSCSQYTIDALERFGAVKGLVMGFKRVVRCHPWGGSGWDPVPEFK